MIKGMHQLVSIATSMATGIKGVCYHDLVCKADQWDWGVSDLQAVLLLRNNWNATALSKITKLKKQYNWVCNKVKNDSRWMKASKIWQKEKEEQTEEILD